MPIAILRCDSFPSFDIWGLTADDEAFDDDRLLVEELARRGIETDFVVWDDPSVEWSRYDVAVLRSTWNYINYRERFLATLEKIARSGCRVLNSLEAVRWNSSKEYLFDLARRGLPVVPTVRVVGGDPSDAIRTAEREGWSSVVVKPVVGAGAVDVALVDIARLQQHLDGLIRERGDGTLLVQPLIESVRSEGEWSYVFFDGVLSHVLLKKPAEGDFKAHPVHGGSIELVTPDERDRAHVEAMMRAMPFETLYARIDLVRVDGILTIMEVEQIEPMLYCAMAPGAVARFADAIVARRDQHVSSRLERGARTS
jgi:glutathione synthase/RimK-type ligase-like ATP-grasp enzyme